jgi:hypothetical protein
MGADAVELREGVEEDDGLTKDERKSRARILAAQEGAGGGKGDDSFELDIDAI